LGDRADLVSALDRSGDGKVMRLLVTGAGEEAVDQTGRKRVSGAYRSVM